MKKLLSIIGLAFILSASQAQTVTNGPSSTLWDFLTTGSNYWAVPFGTYSMNSHEFGGGVAVGYRVSDIVNPVVRLDYFSKRLYMVSLNAEIQVPRKLMGKIPLTPFAVGGVATGLSGLGQDNGTAIGIVGGGFYVDFKWTGSTSWLANHTALVVDYERWVGLPSNQADQFRIGAGISF